MTDVWVTYSQHYYKTVSNAKKCYCHIHITSLNFIVNTQVPNTNCIAANFVTLPQSALYNTCHNMLLLTHYSLDYLSHNTEHWFCITNIINEWYTRNGINFTKKLISGLDLQYSLLLFSAHWKCYKSSCNCV